VDELAGLNLESDARRAQYQPEVKICVAGVGDYLRGFLQHFRFSMRGGREGVNLRFGGCARVRTSDALEQIQFPRQILSITHQTICIEHIGSRKRLAPALAPVLFQ
jgi:hypothetical protein